MEALECALQLEKNVNQSLLDLQKMATEHNDPHVRSRRGGCTVSAVWIRLFSKMQHIVFFRPPQMCDFIETHFLDEQVKSIKQLADWSSNLRRMGAPQSGMAEYLFDKHTMAEEGS